MMAKRIRHMRAVLCAAIVVLCCLRAGVAQQRDDDRPQPEQDADGSKQVSRKGIFGKDDLTDESKAKGCAGEACSGSVTSAVQRIAKAASVALVRRSVLEYDAKRNAWVPRRTIRGRELTGRTIGSRYNLCTNDSATGKRARFQDQHSLASCSGTVVKWNATAGTGLVATTGHCFDKDKYRSGCQNTDGHLLAPPNRTQQCKSANNGVCEDSGRLRSNYYARYHPYAYTCPAGSDEVDCGHGRTAPKNSLCDFLFVFDYDDHTVTRNLKPYDPKDNCTWNNDGVCDASYRGCANGTDSNDCQTDRSPTIVFPAADVYECSGIELCDEDTIKWDHERYGMGYGFNDYALLRISAHGISSSTDTCEFARDGQCDDGSDNRTAYLPSGEG